MMPLFLLGAKQSFHALGTRRENKTIRPPDDEKTEVGVDGEKRGMEEEDDEEKKGKDGKEDKTR